MKSRPLCYLSLVLALVTTNALAQEEPATALLTPHKTLMIQLPKSRLPIVFGTEVLYPIKRAIVADMEYMISFATDEELRPAQEEPPARYRGKDYVVQQYV